MNRSKLVIPGAMAFAALVGVASSAAITAISASAETSSSTTATADTTDSSTVPDQSRGGHKGASGTTEEILTGDTATKVTEAAKAAVPGATIQRVETDAEGAAYEAHMTKSDGSQVTVKFDSSYNVTSTENGMR